MEIAELPGNQQQYSSDRVSFLGDNALKGKKVLFLGVEIIVFFVYVMGGNSPCV